MNKTTEQDSNHKHLDKMDTISLLKGINQEDKGVSLAVERIIPKIEPLVDAIHLKWLKVVVCFISAQELLED